MPRTRHRRRPQTKRDEAHLPHNRPLQLPRRKGAADYGRDDDLLQRPDPVALGAAMEPAAYGRDDMWPLGREPRVPVSPQWSPPLTGGTTGEVWLKRHRGFASPQWS